MENKSSMNTNAWTARLRSSSFGTIGMLRWFGIGNHEVALGAAVPSCGVAGIGEQHKGGRVSAGGEDV